MGRAGYEILKFRLSGYDESVEMLQDYVTMAFRVGSFIIGWCRGFGARILRSRRDG